MFPDSYFIAILRHPIPTVLATQKWDPGTRPHALLEHWLRAHELFVEDMPHLRRLHVLRYEDLVVDPDAELERAFAFLGLDDPNAGREPAEGVNVDNFADDQTLRANVNDRYFAEWRSRRSSMIGRLYYGAFERRYERRVRAFGYSLREPASVVAPTVPLPGLVGGARHPARTA